MNRHGTITASRHVSRRQRGAMAIEFVLLFPIFLLVFYAIVSYGILFAQLHLLNGMADQAARESRRAVIDEHVDSTIDSLVDDVVERYQGLLNRNVTGCTSGSNKSHFDLTTGMLNICLEAEVRLPPPLFTADTLQGRTTLRLAAPSTEEPSPP